MTFQKRLLLATQNHAKFLEIKSIIERYAQSHKITILTPDRSPIADIKEGIQSYEANAKAKAMYFTERFRVDSLGEDSGIEIPALNGFPGVVSARFVKGSDMDRNNALLERMKHLEGHDRHALFKAYVVIACTNGSFFTGYGALEGHITEALSGSNGFGYDSIFVPDGCDITLAKLNPEEKNGISHRKKAIMSVIEEYLRSG
ncbi:MAG: non-canonical purine NTP pyrophosphatase [Deltaproteobacteria bacterium]|nr:non-canonical purine NTP pyrophosphatase [Deltaproteobacteria bacterium]MCL5792578.1 non-canonical purine NTP pyrophosphatase [Deltaproteobacteria bacterium]